MFRLTAITGIFIAFIYSLPAQTSVDTKKLDTALLRLYQTNRFSGTVLYGEKGKVVFSKAYGLADFRTGKALSTSSAFNLASITKQFVAMCIMILSEKTGLAFDDDIKKYLPELPYHDITLRHLLTHTSGLPEYFDIYQQYRSPLDTLTNEKLVQLLATHKTPPVFEPGSKWAYCNTNYVLLGAIIERVSKITLQEFIQKNIVNPLGLKDSYVYEVTMHDIPANHVYGFSEVDGQRKLNDLTNVDGVTGDGNMYSSVEDLFKWEQSLYTEKLVRKITLLQAMTPVHLKNGTTYPYGFGWFLDPGKELYKHTGSWAGFKNIICRDTKNKRTLIVLSNGDNPTGRSIADSIFEGLAFSIRPTFLISHVQLVDGTGIPARAADVRVEGNRILSVGNLKPFTGEPVVDGNGKVLAPGFIDSHSHVGGSLENEPHALAALNQGITTIVSGQDGDSDPVDTLTALFSRRPIAINMASYTGHTTIREIVMGSNNLNRPANADELEKIKLLLQAELKKGSLGLSTGLEYEGAFYSSRDEVIALAKTTAAGGGRYISHIRNEDSNMPDAIDEIINIGREAKLPVQISHIKIALKDDWGTAPAVLALLQHAREEGIDITADCYPYDYWNSTIRVLFPKKDFTNPDGAAFAVAHLFDPAGSVLVRFAPDTSYKGKTVSAVAAMRGETPAQTLLYLVAAASRFSQLHPEAEGVETIMSKSMSGPDVSAFLSWANTNICSDGANGGHPRGYGTFTRVLGNYVREKKIMSLENAIHKMTALTAEHVGIKNRGIIAAGYFADMVLFDPETVKDNASIQNSKALSDGILRVWVNGIPVYQDKQSTNLFPGVFVGR